MKYILTLLAIIVIGTPALAEDMQAPRHGFRDANPEQRKQMIADFKKENPRAFERMNKFRNEIKDLPPEQRQERIDEMRNRFKEQREQRKIEFDNKWQNASDEERSVFCDRFKEDCEAGIKRGCWVFDDKCK